MELQKEASRLHLREDKNYTRGELVILAKVAGIQYIEKFNKRCLAFKLGVGLLTKS